MSEPTEMKLDDDTGEYTEPIELPPTPTPVQHPRITVVETVYHQGVNESPTHYSFRFSRELKSDEQPYTRRADIGEGWATLDTGWVRNPAVLLLNLPSPIFQRIPSPEDLIESYTKIVDIGVLVTIPDEGKRTHHSAPIPPLSVIPFATLLPGESMRITPFQEREFMIRCRSGSTKLVVTALPG